MACCGRGPGLERPSPPPRPKAPAAARRPAAAAPTTFVYVGAGALALSGPVTGATYRFAGPGARVSVHPADAPALVGIRGLRAAL